MTTTKRGKTIDDLHFEHQLWKAEAKFYEDELKIYQKRLEEIVSKYTREEVLKQIEHFQNQFQIENQQLNRLSHDVNVHEKRLANFAKDNPETSDLRLLPDHKIMHDKLETFRKIYVELKKEFSNFLIAWL